MPFSSASVPGVTVVTTTPSTLGRHAELLARAPRRAAPMSKPSEHVDPRRRADRLVDDVGLGGCTGSPFCSMSAISCSPASSRPSVMSSVCSVPSRSTSTGTALPTAVSATIRGRSRISSIGLAVELRMMSPSSTTPSDGPLVRDVDHQRAERIGPAEARGDVVGHLLDADAEPAAPRLAELGELLDHRLARG